MHGMGIGHRLGMKGIAGSTRIESRRGARGRGSLNFAGQTTVVLGLITQKIPIVDRLFY